MSPKLSYTRDQTVLHAGDGGRGRRPRKGAGPHLGALDRALLSPCPFAIFHVCRAYLGAGFQTPTLFFSGGDFETQKNGSRAWRRHRESLPSTRPLPPPGPGAAEEGHAAQGLGVPWAAWTAGLARSEGSSAIVWGLTPAVGVLCSSCHPQRARPLHWAVSSLQSSMAARL